MTLLSSPPGNKWSWAAYLGASWTWCIGMFLPVLLIRDYGPWAWLIFAVPNAVGAAAMGWVMRSSAASRQYTADHASACRLFSFVTIAFQLYFSLWMLPQLIGPIGFVGAAILVQSAFTPLTKERWLRVGGAIALGLSVVIAIGLAQQHVLSWPQSDRVLSIGDATGLLGVCLAGFVACPYLDLTFHRARQETTDTGAKFAFGVGFCVLFASMIVLTFFYADRLMPVARNTGNTLGAFRGWFLALHLTVQMTYTVHVHSAELARQAVERDDRGTMRAGLGLWLAIALAAGLASAYAVGQGIQYHREPLGEAGYRIFMSFYGLLFPAYALLAIGGRRVAVAGWLGVSLAAAPFYWLAFLERRMTWAVVGVAVMLVGVAIVRLITRPARGGQTE